MTAPLQNLHIDVWRPARVRGQGREQYFLLVVDDYSRYTTVFPLRSKWKVPDVLIPWIRAVRFQLRERFRTDLPILRLHSDRGGEFSSDLLRNFCQGEGILQSFTLPASPQQNGIAERRIGLVMEVARTSMIHAAAPHFLWPFAVRYVAHQLNLWLRVSLPETSPTLRWTGEVGDASRFRVWGSRAFVRDTTADKLSSRAVPYVFLGFPPDAPGCDSGAAGSGAVSRGAEPERAEPGGAEPAGAEPGGAEPGGAEPGGAEPGGAEPGGAAPRGAEPAGAEFWSRATGAGGDGAANTGAGGAGAGGAGAGGTGAGGTGVGDAGAGDAGAGGAGAGDAAAGGTELEALELEPLALEALELEALDLETLELEALALEALEALELEALELEVLELLTLEALKLEDSPLPAPPLYTEQPASLTERREPASRPASPVRTARRARRVMRPRPPPVPGTHTMALRPSSVPQRVPLPSPPASSLLDVLDSESDLVRATSPTITRLLATVVTDPSFESTVASALVAELVDFAATCSLDYTTSLVAESESVCPPSVGGECALGTDVLEDKQEDFECLAAAIPYLVAWLLAPEGDPNALDIPTPRSYTEAISGPYSSQWQTAMDAEMASWKSTGTYVDEVPPPGANIVDGIQRQGVDFFQTFSPTPKMTTLRVLLHVAAQRDYELHSLDFSTAFLQGSLHEEIWLRRPPGFTGSFPPGTQWSLRRPVYGLR
ncbi:unnamed protein product [Closterium sp. Yama58-4]|nr:unnamed protein product [Closterium sp. Yama58-4]